MNDTGWKPNLKDLHFESKIICETFGIQLDRAEEIIMEIEDLGNGMGGFPGFNLYLEKVLNSIPKSDAEVNYILFYFGVLRAQTDYINREKAQRIAGLPSRPMASRLKN